MRRLQQAISQLTNDQQQVLALKFFGDMTNGEIASDWPERGRS
ncbi:MAG: sigma factor-like helix-turn-helix DNA-binding protein [Kouleothrix sp.]